MSPKTRKQLNSLNTKQILDSPEAFEIVEFLRDAYHAKCKTEKRYEEMIQSLLDRIYGRKSEKSKYHPDQALLFPELLEALTGEVDEEPNREPIDASEPVSKSPSDWNTSLRKSSPR